jgi:hypothetical protein
MAPASGSSRTSPLSTAILAHIAADLNEFKFACRHPGSRTGPLTEVARLAPDQCAFDCSQQSPCRFGCRPAALFSSDRSVAPELSRDDEVALLDTIQRALRLRTAVLTDCAGLPATEWHMSEAQIQKVLEAFGSVVCGSGPAPTPAPAPVPKSPSRPLVQNYGQSVHLFPAAVAQGMPVATALAAFVQVSSG